MIFGDEQERPCHSAGPLLFYYGIGIEKRTIRGYNVCTLSHIFMDTQLLIIAFLRIRTLDKLFEATIALVNFRICN